jgi:hypothetical protein
VLIGLLLGVLLPPTKAAEEYLHVRAGLPNCPHKFQPGTWINTIFVQGAATSGEGESHSAYHSEVMRCLRATFPGASGGAPVIAGGAGSWWAAFCAARGQAVYGQHLPGAILFVDVATDDGDATEDQVCAALEGLVRQLWTTYAGTDLVFLYGLRRDNLDTYKAGKLPPEEWTYAVNPDGKDYRAQLLRLASEEGCEFLDMTGPWWQYVQDSGKTYGWFRGDAVHANERGTQILARILERYFTR